MSYVSRYYVDSLGEEQLYTKATNGMLEELHDPYSVLLVGDDYKALTETTTGNYGGLGIQIDVRDGWITVVAPLPDTPAERAGIETGDQIVAIDGKPTEGWNNDQAVRTLRGTAGSDVTLSVRRVGYGDPLEFKLTRAQIHVRSVSPGTMFPDAVGLRVAEPGERDLVRRAARRNRRDAVEGDEVAGAGPPHQSGRAARPGGQGLRPLPQQGAGGRFDPGAGPGLQPRVLRRRQASRGRRCRSWCWSTAGRPAPPRSSPGRCRTTTARSWWGRRPSARGWSRRSSRCRTTPRSS